MPVVNVLYLPRDERLRAVVRTALDFIEEVYREEVLSSLKVVAFDYDDETDIGNVARIAHTEGFGITKHEQCKIEPGTPIFFRSHYKPKYRYIWIPIWRHYWGSDVLRRVAHETAHHLYYSVMDSSERDRLAMSVLTDVPEIEEVVRKVVPRTPSDQLVMAIEAVSYFMSEIVAIYITENYFMMLKRGPETPVSAIPEIATVVDILYHRERPSGFLLLLLMLYPEEVTPILSTIYRKFAIEKVDLPRFRETLHGLFTRYIKKLPADVLESNKVKYGVLYGREPLIPFSN
jgi:hypothetical protein